MLMSSRNDNLRTKTLVLGGGGAVGVSWQVGLIGGLRDAGVELADANEVLGTSAGALVGALLASDLDVADALAALAALGTNIDAHTMTAANTTFLDSMHRANLASDPEQAIRDVGCTALTAYTIPEDTYLGLFALLDGIAWPAGFRCTAIDTVSGELVVWDQNSGVPLRDAVASSCAIPALFPPVTIMGRRYMDGGIISHLNSTSVLPSDVVVVLSCHPLSEAGGGALVSASSLGAENGELEKLGTMTRVVPVEPRFDQLAATAEQMMDPAIAGQAIKIGRDQAESEAPTIRSSWTD
jgi:NTE family protein